MSRGLWKKYRIFLSDVKMTLEQFNKLAEEFNSQLIEISKKCEVEHPTVNSVSETINSFGLEPKLVDDAGVVAELLEQNSASRDIALRVAIHDPVQAAIGLGIICFLNPIKEQVSGQFCIIFHNEKTGSNFSQKLIQENGLTNIFGLWNLRTNSNIPSGTVGVKLGSVFSTVEDFKLTVLSKNNSPNVVPVTTNVITALSQLTSRKTDPLKPAKITICSIHSSGPNGFAPNSVEIKGNFATSDEAVAQKIPSLIKESVQGLTGAYGVEFEIQMTKRSVVTFDESLSLHLSNAAKEVLGSDKVITLEYSREPSLNLRKYLETVPGSNLEIGTGKLNSDSPLDKRIKSGFKTVSWAFLKYLN